MPSIELARDVLEKLICPACGKHERLLASLGRVRAEAGKCPNCGSRRDVQTFYTISGTEDFLDLPLSEIGVPAFDIVIARSATNAIGLELAGDAPSVLGPLFDDEGLAWE